MDPQDLYILESLEAELDELGVAAERLEGGTDGLRELCSKKIPPERREAVPATRWCVAHRGR